MLYKNLESLIRRGWRLEVGLDTLSPRFHAVIHDNDRGSGHNHVGMTLNQAVNGLEGYVGDVMKLDASTPETGTAPEPPEKTWTCICGRSMYVTVTRCEYCGFRRPTANRRA